jgi:hypothetical protein
MVRSRPPRSVLYVVEGTTARTLLVREASRLRAPSLSHSPPQSFVPSTPTLLGSVHPLPRTHVSTGVTLPCGALSTDSSAHDPTRRLPCTRPDLRQSLAAYPRTADTPGSTSKRLKLEGGRPWRPSPGGR